LTQRPTPPWNYNLTFHINGLTNEYYGSALFLRDGEIAEVPCFDGCEVLNFPPPIGKLEAAVTSGGLSTLPFSLRGKVQTLENKTLRYPGHWEKFKSYWELGLFELEPVEIGDQKIVPRDFYHKLLEPKLTSEFVEDIGIIKIVGTGTLEGDQKTVELDLIDTYDRTTRLTAMQRLTGWHASIMAIYSAEKKIGPGVIPVQDALPGRTMIDEFKKRGVSISERIY
jgi:lysine 6-dehydrogenase